jgi:hypothetical protein
VVAALAALAAVLAWAAAAPAAEATRSEYRGWQSLRLANGLVEVQVVPDIGGRVIQFKLADFEYLWVNPQLAGQEPPPSGLAPDGGWLNYGGDKLWPAPQGWDGAEQWPGPPDAVLDGSPHRAAIVDAAGPSAAVALISRDDPRSGIRFSRVIRVFDASTRVSFDSTMKNIDTKPRRWGIWQVTQLNASNRAGEGYNPQIRCWSPINPASRYPRGYYELFGLVNNPSFKADPEKKLFSAHYQRIVGKAGLDNSAGWTAVVDGTAGYVFVERFTYVPDKEYPDGASVEFWMNGAGQFAAAGKLTEIKDDPVETPHLVESEILSPFAELGPGENYTFHLDWFAARIGGNYPILDCTPVGVVCEPFAAEVKGGKVRLAGRFGVFYEKAGVSVVFLDASDKECGSADLKAAAAPTQPLALAAQVPLPAQAATAVLVLTDSAGKRMGELARAKIQQ